MWLFTEFIFNFLEISYGRLQTQYLTAVQIYEEHNLWLWLRDTKHILSSRYNLPHGLGEVEPRVLSTI
jgi:hypothetical protein